ncbi:nicotinate-nucleotide--dimethylbenzimidazole phosphoribosyltransferase [Streptomyces sp. NBC_01537]|uniref:nicotinate-nucleotide--dimethylbenzimidazole phosphoribosyltransferase n=1 Tax=Streptomyces sp. NBC_01537 TaxID=2903896 RepID=UPI00386E9C57
MTDTGQVPGEGLPGNAGEEAVLHPQHHADLPGNAELQGIAAPQQPMGAPTWDSDPLTAPVPPAYTFLEQPGGPVPVPIGADEDEDLLIMPGPQASWGDPQPVPLPTQSTMSVPVPTPVPVQVPVAAPVPEHVPVPEPVPVQPLLAAPEPAEPVAFQPVVAEPLAPEPVAAEPVAAEPAAARPVEPAPIADPVPVQVVAAPEAHEEDGRDSGSVDFAAVRALAPEPVQPTPAPARRPLHMGPPMPDPATGGVVRSLADRGPATQVQVPVQVPTPATPATPVPLRQPGPPTTGPEYLDVPRDEPAVVPTVAPAPAPTPAPVPVPAADPVPQVTPVAGTAWPAPVPVEAPEPEPEPVLEAEAVEPPVDDVPPLPFGLEPADAPQESVAEPEPEPVVEPEPALVVEAAPEPEPEPVVVAVSGAADVLAEPEPAPAPEAEPEPVEEPAAVVPEVPQVQVETVVAEPEPELEAVEEPVAEAAAEEAEAEAVEEAVEASAPAPAPGAPAAEGYDAAVRDAVHRVIRERRDIRNGFRSDPIPHEVLIRVLEAAHTAPSVGHSQPWDFVVIRSAKTRERMHELAMHQREAYAKSLPKGRAKQFRELKIEAILDTPVNIVVTADPTRGGRHTLGRYTQPQMAPYSSALAVENLWLAARAEGLGVGWVSFFDEREMVRELGLPEHLEVVAYLCVGYVDEFPEDPELVQAGWSKRRPLAWVVHEEEYGNRALPGEAPHDLLEETLRGIRPLDAKALGEAWERQKRMTKPAGALGMLEIISAQLSGLSRQCPPPIPEPAAVAIFAGDHGVHAQGVTAWPQEVTAQMVANFLGGGAVCNAFANQVGAEVCVVDVGVAAELPNTPGLLPRKVRYGTSDFTVGPAMSREDALRAIEVGIETARDLVAAGNRALLTGEMGVANTTVSAALISVYTGVDPAEITGRGTGINDEMHARKVDVVRRALELHRPDPADPIEVLAAIGGLEHAAMVGLLLGAASLRTPVILDGVSAGAAALVARAIAPEVLAACIAGHRSAEPGHRAALTKLGLRPLVDLDLRLGEGTGALLALPLVQSAARAMHEVATFDSAGVTEKA